IAVEAEFSVWNLAIDSTTPDPQLCQGEGGDELEQPNQADDAGTGGAGGYGDQFGGINFWINFYNTFGGGGPGGPEGPGFPMNPNEQYGTCVEFEYVTEVGRCEYKTETIRVFGCPCEDDEGETGT